MKPRDKNAERKAELKRVFGNAPCSSPFWRRIYWALRGFQYWLCFYDTEAEIEVDDLNLNPFNTMPPSLDRLHHATAFDKKWLMFLYRNFKQRCPSGRMGASECRAIFRQFFPRAAHYAFADRLFQAITKQTGRPFITFEDLVLCLFDLTDGSHHLNGDLSTAHSTANFIANIIGTDEKGRVSLDAWVGYASAIWGLRACRSAAAANAASLGLAHGNSVHASKSMSLHGDSEVAASKRLAPLFERYARERFLEFDTDGDGFVTLDDIEREIDLLYGNDLILHTKAEYLC
ncbi:unnamed protein product, partial [Mesorhabditis belari]|uniref:EF-hand domain-containing protein n=1 Tax=Mesorhabditis belari TaxID=2138241 RepID=A0AAF3EWP1_9BILA